MKYCVEYEEKTIEFCKIGKKLTVGHTTVEKECKDLKGHHNKHVQSDK